MARPKVGLIYYNLDTDRYQDIRIKRLKKDFGCSGVAVYDYILNEIYRVKGCFIEWDESRAFDVADYWNIKESLVNEIVNYCCVVGLFNKELLTSERIITSLSIQRRYMDMCARAKRKDAKIPEQYKIITEESDIVTEECTQTSGSLRQSNSKVIVKESKESIYIERERQFLGLVEEIKLNETAWLDVFYLKKTFKPSDVDLIFTEFVKTLIEQDYGEHTMSEFKNHFSNWLRKNKSGGSSGANRGGSSKKATPRSKQEVDYSKEEYKGNQF